MLTPRFKSANVDAAYRHQGWIMQPLLERNAIALLTQGVRAVFPEVAEGFVSSVWQAASVRRHAHEVVMSILKDALPAVLTDYRVVLSSFVVRSSGSTAQDMPLHQDWTFVDETVAQSMGVWLPLQDVDAANGCLQLVPGSHLHQQPKRAMGGGFRYRVLETKLREQYLVDVPLKTGEAVFFDHRLIHCSRANHSNLPRYAVGAVLLPRTQPLHLGFKLPNGGLAFRDVADDFLLHADLPAIAGA